MPASRWGRRLFATVLGLFAPAVLRAEEWQRRYRIAFAKPNEESGVRIEGGPRVHRWPNWHFGQDGLPLAGIAAPAPERPVRCHASAGGGASLHSTITGHYGMAALRGFTG